MCAAAIDPLRDFADAVGHAGNPVALLPAAFSIARMAYPELDPAPYVSQLSAWGAEVQGRIADVSYPMPRVRILREFIFKELGFTGNRDTYYDDRNSFLNDVIDRRKGIPISLSVVTLAIAEFAGMPVRGVGFPGHFLVRYMGDEDSYILFDPFTSGEILIEADCMTRLRAIYGPDAVFEPRMVEPVASRQIITRMLANLKGVYLQQKDYGNALAVVDRLMLIEPNRSVEHRDRGMLLLSLQRYQSAIASLRHYLDIETAAPDAAGIRRLIGDIQSRYEID
ncbi:MAG: tetratricopeptide repeat protein [Candidatus Sericytochromatia bacterium]|nr:tetratricopeptide repeat protein [Candidatus Sericytochromatia bacterium]